MTEALPLVRSGGIFLIVVRLTIGLGVIQFRSRHAILALGAVAACVALGVLAVLSAPYGAPSAMQLASLTVAVVFEVAMLVVFVPGAARRGDRAITATVLGGGAHFLFMAPAFGPLIVALGLANGLNAAIGARWAAYPLPAMWAVDGMLKAGEGLAMFASMHDC